MQLRATDTEIEADLSRRIAEQRVLTNDLHVMATD
jgi:hypothetical protein